MNWKSEERFKSVFFFQRRADLSLRRGRRTSGLQGLQSVALTSPEDIGSVRHDLQQSGPRWEMGTLLDYKPNSSVLYITNIHLTCCSCRKVPSCSYWMIWPSGIWGTKQQSDLHGYTSNLSCDMTSWGKTDLYVAAIRYHNILMRGQVGHSFLGNDVLDLALQKRQYSCSKKHLFISWYGHVQ